MDAVIKFLKSPHPVSDDGILQHGGCGNVYDSIVMYAHSTGGLVASLYGSDGGGAWRGAIDGFLFNSPFWNWNLRWYEGLLVKNAYRTGVQPEFVTTACSLSSRGGWGIVLTPSLCRKSLVTATYSPKVALTVTTASRCTRPTSSPRTSSR